MVIKPFTHLARQSFGKSLTHGYAQSVVAATQSSYASSTTSFPQFGQHNRHIRPLTSQTPASFQYNAIANVHLSRTIPVDSGRTEDQDDRLQAYLEAWQSQQLQSGTETKPWKQYQFAKTIEWRQHSVAPERSESPRVTGDTSKVDIRQGIERSYSTSAIDDLRNAKDVAEASDLVTADAALNHQSPKRVTCLNHNRESNSEGRQDLDPSKHDSIETSYDSCGDNVDHHRGRAQGTSSSWVTQENATSLASHNDGKAVYLPLSEKIQVFLSHIDKLSVEKKFAQIPSVFQAMLDQGLHPTPQVYDSLLAAATASTPSGHQLVSKILDIYADALRRKIVPHASFFASLIDIFCYRALQCSFSKAQLERRLLRYSSSKGEIKHLLASDQTEHAIVAEDDALLLALDLLETANSNHVSTLPAKTYGLMVIACAEHGLLNEMVRIHRHMENHKMQPMACMFPPMIRVFASNDRLSDAVDCYTQYKRLATIDFYSTSDFEDVEVYSALVRAFLICGDTTRAENFLEKVIASYSNSPKCREARVTDARDTILLKAFVEDLIASKHFAAALTFVGTRKMTPAASSEAYTKISVTAADENEIEDALEAYKHIHAKADIRDATFAIMAYYLRSGKLNIASNYWESFKSSATFDASHIQPMLFFFASLIYAGRGDEAAAQARKGFKSLRASAQPSGFAKEIRDQVGEALDLIVSLTATRGVKLSPTGSLDLLWTMVENEVVSSVGAEQLLANLDRAGWNTLSWQNAKMALQIEAGLLVNSEECIDAARCERFTHLLDFVVEGRSIMDGASVGLIRRAIERVSILPSMDCSDWKRFESILNGPSISQRTFPLLPAPAMAVMCDPYATGLDHTAMAVMCDPYATGLDHKGSNSIIEDLDTRRSGGCLDNALNKFKHIRRSGRHPRYVAYAKLISAAARENRIDLMHDIIAIARTDVPFQAAFATVRSGWSLILDSMIGACLSTGQRCLAEKFHQEILSFGAAPTANTFGLYITSLKNSTQTFDEATEAVSIFNRARSEGVAPSSFLYNALIGKLGKARRIDECLQFFNEMTTAGIRPTSVTYGTIVNALCRVSDERLAEQYFEEMEVMPNYKPRPAPYNSLMQFLLNTKRDSNKVLAYYDRMLAKNIRPTMHTYKLLIDTFATLEPINLSAAEGVLDTIRASGQTPEAVHFASLIHAKGCVLHDMEGARQIFDNAITGGEVRVLACLYQALFESMVANHCVAQTEPVLESMLANRIEMTPYIANTLIHGWATENMVIRSKAIYDSIGISKREPSTYEAMIRAFLTDEDHQSAMRVAQEMLSRGYPHAVSSKIYELVSHGMSPTVELAHLDTPA